MSSRCVIVSWIVSLLLVGGVAIVDYYTGDELGLFIAYFLPISLLAWYVGRTHAVALAIGAAVAWLISDMASGHGYSRAWYAYWNAGIRGVTFVVLAITVSQIAHQLFYQRVVIADLNDALGRVRRLEGLLPICASCKSIRDEHGLWRQIEAYVSERTDAQFSHGLCPHCTQEIYPEFAEQIAANRAKEAAAGRGTGTSGSGK